MNDEIELLPCPLCGGKAEITQRGTKSKRMIIECSDCGCAVHSGDVFGLTLPSDYAWNRRHENQNP